MKQYLFYAFVIIAGMIRRVTKHRSQQIYTRTTKAEEAAEAAEAAALASGKEKGEKEKK